MCGFTFWKWKKADRERNEEPVEYSIEEIERMTQEAQDENERRIKKDQEDYLQLIERSIGHKARKGETSFVTHAVDGFEDYITPSFLSTIADIYAKKGYETTIVQPDPQDPNWMWVRIEWKPKNKKVRFQ